MKIRAIIFDIYGTLLEVGPPPPDAEARWQRLFLDLLQTEPRLSRLAFSVASSRVIARHHVAARARGIPWPEVHWPSIVTEALPELAQLSRSDQEEFSFRPIQIGHTTRMTAETATTLRRLKARPGLLGLASNAQAYTVRELQESLTVQGLDVSLFERDLCFWSFEQGFSKPDPHVFRMLTARLAAREIAPQETLMVGDRVDTDVEPARAQAWHAWHLRTGVNPGGGGDWQALCRWLESGES